MEEPDKATSLQPTVPAAVDAALGAAALATSVALSMVRGVARVAAAHRAHGSAPAHLERTAASCPRRRCPRPPGP